MLEVIIGFGTVDRKEELNHLAIREIQVCSAR